ncbi:MAG: MTH1187 family thiamine-binding protein [Gammaproteobacteria bacterium]|nr:MTH1187 family thiamine-binding protein [Gammaproteobacteria bacterium]
MSTLLEFSIFPTDRGESVSKQVSLVIAVIRDSGLPYRLTAMGTIVESSEPEQALELVARCYRTLERAGCRRVYASLKLDIRQQRDNGLQQKLDSVRERIGEVAS